LKEDPLEEMKALFDQEQFDKLIKDTEAHDAAVKKMK